MKKPVLFLIFNRPDTTKKVFESIREYQPKELYIAADGPRLEREGEKELCEETRKITEKIDWNCKVKTLFREKNLGCRDAVSSAITWFFENVEDGIILEDDCLPNQSFFRFCEEMLDKYKDNEKIMHIGGNNFQLGKYRPEADYYFSKLNHVWGWATWKDSWFKYDNEMKDLENFIKDKKIETIFKNKKIRKNWINNFIKTKDREINTWDYIWTYSIWNENGLAILPSVNLVQNIGFDSRSTHTQQPPHFINKFNKEARENTDFVINKNPSNIKRDEIADVNYYKNISVSFSKRILRKIISLKNEM